MGKLSSGSRVHRETLRTLSGQTDPKSNAWTGEISVEVAVICG